MSITDAIIDDMYQEHLRDTMREHHNAITTMEVEMKFDKVCAEIRALESYLGCFEREWGREMEGIYTSLAQYRSDIDDLKINFINSAYDVGR